MNLKKINLNLCFVFLCLITSSLFLQQTAKGEENFSKLKWVEIERIIKEHVEIFTERAEIPAGWLIRSQIFRHKSHYEKVLAPNQYQPQNITGFAMSMGYGQGVGLTFIPDPEHSWKLE